MSIAHSSEPKAASASGPHVVTAAEGVNLTARIQGCSILVVDDIDFNRTLLGALLDGEGYHNVRFAVSGQDALEAIAEEKPDLLILDLMMPGVDGFEVCRRLREDPATRDLPILVQTALTSSEDRNRAFTSGTTDLVSKPVDRGELLARVRIHLEHRVLVSDLLTYHDRVESELSLARTMYEHLLPPPMQLEGLEQSNGITLRALTRLSFDRGGSLWSLNRLDADRLAVCLFSVATGESAPCGMTAALHMFRLHTWLSERIPTLEDPGLFLTRLQQDMGEMGEMMSGLTPGLLLAVIDRQNSRLDVATAGMPAPVILDGDSVRPLSLPVTAGLGGGEEHYTTCSCSLTPQTVFLFHDSPAVRWLHEMGENSAARILASLQHAAASAGDDGGSGGGEADFLIVWGQLQPGNA